jgi:hypothetical protein
VDHERLKRIQRAEVAARLAMLDTLIEEQRARVAHSRAMAWDATLSEQRLRLLLKARELHCRAFAAAYGEGVLEDRRDD